MKYALCLLDCHNYKEGKYEARIKVLVESCEGLCLVDGMIKKLLRSSDPLISIDFKMQPVNDDIVEVSENDFVRVRKHLFTYGHK